MSVAPYTLSKRLINLIPLATVLMLLAATAALLASCSGDAPESGTDSELGDADTNVSTESGDTDAAVSKDQPLAYAQALVQQAIDRYERDGREATIDYYNSDESLDGEWHVFVLDDEGYIVSMAAFPNWVGVHDSEFKGYKDYPAGQMVIDGASEQGIQISYFTSGLFGGLELKHLWVVKHEDLIFGSSSWSGGSVSRSDQSAYTQEYVRLAIGLYEASGRQALIDYYNNPNSLDDRWYMFIADETGQLIVHGANRDLVDTPLVDVTGANAYPSGQIVADDASPDGAWSDYIFYNPETNRSQIKHSWLVTHDGLIFGSGWYEDGPARSDEPEYTQTLVQQAINLYNSSGLDVALEYYNDPVSVDEQWYVFIIDANTRELIGHFNPELRGADTATLEDPTGYSYGVDLMDTPEEGLWLDYVIRNPGTGEDSRKHTWAVLHDGHIFGSGWYE